MHFLISMPINNTKKVVIFFHNALIVGFFGVAAFFGFATTVAAVTAPVATVYLNGGTANISVAQNSTFTLQAVGTDSPVVCFMATYLSSVGAWSSYSAYDCATYQSPQMLAATSFGFSAGWNGINVAMWNASGWSNQAVGWVFLTASTYTISASSGAGGSVSPDGNTSVTHGNSQAYTITPNSGYSISSVIVDGVNHGAISSYTFSSVTANHTISASFADVTAPVITVAGSNPVAVTAFTSYTDAGATASDFVNGTRPVSTTGVVDTSVVGIYIITYEASDLSGNTATTTRTVNVVRATPVITWSNPADIIYGTALSGTQLNATTPVAGAFAYVPASGSAINAGNGQILSVTFTPSDTTNYNSTTTSVVINVTQAPLTVTATAQTKVYGASDPALTYTSTGLTNGDTNSIFSGVLTRAVGENVGTRAITVGSLSAGSNYAVTFVGDNLTITQASLTITATAQTKVYGASDPALTYTNTALSFSDTISGSLTRASGENVGTYAITQGSVTAGGNYAITYVADNLSITQAPLTITANNETKVYGSANPSFTATYTGFVSGDTSASLSTPVTLSTTASTTSSVGTYAITASGGIASNYSITHVNGTLTVTQAPLTVTADPQTKIYGASDPALTYSITAGALFNGDVLSGTLARSAGSNVGTYAITQGTLSATADYALTFVGDNLSITTASLTVTADPQTKVYGASDPALTYTSTGLTNGDTNSIFSGVLTRAVGENVGTRAITVGSLSAGSNYAVTFVGDNLTITQASLTITATAQTKVYGASDPALTYTNTALSFSDTISGSLTRASGENVGTYAITQGSVTAGGNYAITYVAANFSITQATPTITWTNPADIVFDTPLSVTQLNATTSVSGTFVYVPASGTVLSAGVGQTLSTTFTPTDTVNYSSATSSVLITVLLDNVSPSSVFVTSAHATGTISSNQNVSMSWTTATDVGTGVAGYSFVFDNASTTIPNTTVDTTATTTSQTLSYGKYYFHVRAVDVAGNAGAVAHYGPVILSNSQVLVLNSTIGGVYHDFYSPTLAVGAVSTTTGVTRITNSTITTWWEINNSNLFGVTLDNSRISGVNATSSSIINSDLTNCTINNSTVKNYLGSGCTVNNSTVDPPSGMNNLTGSTFTNSLVFVSDVTYSTTTDSYIATSTVTTSTLTNATSTNSTITTSTLTSSTVDTSAVASSTVLTSTLTNATSTDSSITDSSITDSTIATSTVTNATTTDSTITDSTIATSTIAVSNVVDSTITDSTLTNATSTDSTITDSTIATSTVTNATSTDSTITDSTIATSTIAVSNVVDSTITDSTLTNATSTDSTITDSTIATSTVTNATSTDSTITDSTIATSTITNATTTDAVINTSVITDSTLTNATSTASTITDSTIATSTITNATTTASTLTNVTIESSTIASSTITSSTVTNSTLTNATSTNTTIVDTTLYDTTVTDGFIENGVISSGTITSATGTPMVINSPTILSTIINYPPVASFIAVLNGLILTVTDTSSDQNSGTTLNDSYTYEWNFGDGSATTTVAKSVIGSNQTRTYAVAGVYTVFLRLTDAFSKFSTFITTVTATAPTSSGGGGGGGASSSIISVVSKIVGDMNGDNKVNKYDFSLMMVYWGKVGNSIADLNGDGKVDKYDFSLLMARWSK